MLLCLEGLANSEESSLETTPNQGHYYTGMEKAKQSGMLKDQAISPTARPTPIIALGIRGSTTGGLPSGVDQGRQDISPSKVGGYDRVTPQNLNSKLVDKTPTNPEIHQTSTPINPDPQTGDGVTHPHQIQVTAHEEPQAVTGASTDSDDTLKLKSAVPKGIDIDIAETSPDEEKNENNNTAMIPATSLSETFARHKKLMREKIDLNRECTTCGCGSLTDKHGMTENQKHADDCECNDCLTKKGDSRAYDSTRPLGNTYKGPMTSLEDPHTPSKKHKFPGDPATGYISQRTDESKKPRVCYHCKKPRPCACDNEDEENDKLRRKNPEEYSKRISMKIDKRGDLDPRDRGETVECKNCHNPFNYRLVAEVAMGAVQCPACDAVLDQEGIVLSEKRHPKGCTCGFCKNMGSFGKKKKEDKKEVKEDGGGDDPDFKEKDEKQWRKDRSASKAGDDVRAEFDKDKKKTVKEGAYIPQVKEPDFAYCVGCGKKMPSDHPSSSNQHKTCDACKGYKPGEKKDDKLAEQQRIDESYAAPFQRMRSLAGVGNMILTSNGLMEDRNDPGASKPFNTNWKMDKEKAGFVKIDEEKLNKVKASLERKSKRGTLSDDELELAKKLTEVLKLRQAKA